MNQPKVIAESCNWFSPTKRQDDPLVTRDNSGGISSIIKVYPSEVTEQMVPAEKNFEQRFADWTMKYTEGDSNDEFYNFWMMHVTDVMTRYLGYVPSNTRLVS